MTEVYHFNECSIKEDAYAFQVDAFQNDAFQAKITTDVYAQDVSINYKKDYLPIKNEDGQVIKEYERTREVEVSIGKLFSTGFNFADGNDLLLNHENAVGTCNYLISKCYVQDEGWNQSANDVVKHNIKFVAQTIGTV